MCQAPQPLSENPADLTRAQFEYAWRWFSYHAEQRLKMFNYMLIIMGLFATAVVSAYDKHLPNQFSAGLCFIAAFLAFVFSRLDSRNQQLVWLGEDILIHLEKGALFNQLNEFEGRLIFRSKRGLDDKNAKFGILWRQKQEDPSGSSFWPDEWIKNFFSGKHRYLLRAIAYIIAILFFFAGIWLLQQPDAGVKQQTPIQVDILASAARKAQWECPDRC